MKFGIGELQNKAKINNLENIKTSFKDAKNIYWHSSKSRNFGAFEWPEWHSKTSSSFVPLPYRIMYIAGPAETIHMSTSFLSRVGKHHDVPLKRHISVESIDNTVPSPQSLMAVTGSPEEVTIEKRANDVASTVEMTYPRTWKKHSSGRAPV